MNTILRPLLALSLLCTLKPQLSSAQGSLTPPAGVPAASMKTLDQVEARRPVQSLSAAAPYNITQPGSYYLTGNITVASGSAIVVASDGVSIDLNGFTIRSTQTGAANGSAIGLSQDVRRLTVRNGTLASGTTVPASGAASAAGFQYGIGAASYSADQASVTDVHVTGIAVYGIDLDAQGIVDRCSAADCGFAGIHATVVANSSAANCHTYGINVDKAVTNSSGHSTMGWGIYSFGNASNCEGSSGSGTGLTCSSGADNCRGVSESGIGLSATSATNCSGSSTSGSFGMSISGTATYCRGFRASGIAIQAAIAIGCTTAGGTISSPQKHLGTP